MKMELRPKRAALYSLASLMLVFSFQSFGGSPSANFEKLVKEMSVQEVTEISKYYDQLMNGAEEGNQTVAPYFRETGQIINWGGEPIMELNLFPSGQGIGWMGEPVYLPK